MSIHAKEGEVVELTSDLPTENLKAGTRGTVVEVFTKPSEGYDVEFYAENGDIIGLAYGLKPGQIVKVAEGKDVNG